MFNRLKDRIPARIKDRLNILLCNLWKYRINEEPVLNKPIFIIGCPRSGTTIFLKLFAAHPWVANWSEAVQIWDPDRFNDSDADHYWTADMVTEQDKKRLHTMFECYRQMHKKKRFVNKHPRNSVRIEYINKIFPNALFIHVVRDGRAVANSLMKIYKEPKRQNLPFGNFTKPPNWRQWVRDDPVEQAALQWREIVQYIFSQRERIGHRYYHLRYEDLCKNTKEVLKSAFEFAGLPVLDKYFFTVPDSLKNANHKYEKELSEEQISIINSVQKELLQKLGYYL